MQTFETNLFNRVNTNTSKFDDKNFIEKAYYILVFTASLVDLLAPSYRIIGRERDRNSTS